MRANRMNGSVTAPTDSAYATLARLKIAVPLTQAAALESVGNAESTIITLIDLTRDLTERLAHATFARLGQLDVVRRERLLRSLSQEVAYLIGRSHERGEEIDASRLISNVKMALSSIDHVPGAKTSLFFNETLEQKTQWQLAVTRAVSRITESLMMAPDLGHFGHNFVGRLLDEVEISANNIETENDEERRTVRLSLLTQFSKSHSRLIARVIDRDLAAKRNPDVDGLFAMIDAYHRTLGKALIHLASHEPALNQVEPGSSFSPQI